MSRMHFSNYTPSDADLAELETFKAGLLSGYQQALAAMDWGFEQSSDPEVRRAAQRTLQAIEGLQPWVDEDGSLWLSAAGDVFGAPKPPAKGRA